MLPMKMTKLIRVHVDLRNPKTFPDGFVDLEALNLLTEEQILE